VLSKRQLGAAQWWRVTSLDRETSIGTGGAGSRVDSAALVAAAKHLHEQFSTAVEVLRKLHNSKLKELKEKAVVHEVTAAHLFGAIKDKLYEVVEVQNKLVEELKLVASMSTSATPGLDKLLGLFGAGTPDTSAEQVEALVQRYLWPLPLLSVISPDLSSKMLSYS
jgi:hypothetical protein